MTPDEKDFIELVVAVRVGSVPVFGGGSCPGAWHGDRVLEDAVFAGIRDAEIAWPLLQAHLQKKETKP